MNLDRVKETALIHKDALETYGDDEVFYEDVLRAIIGFYINKGICYENLESYDLAKEVYLKGLEEFPRNYELRNNLSVINTKLEEPQEAFNNL